MIVSDASSVSCARGATFAENLAGSEGGCMFVSGGSVVLCGGRWLRNSAAANGGALREKDESSVSWSEESIFELNAAGAAGGALSLLVNASSVSWDAPTGFYYYYSAGVYGDALVISAQCIASWQSETGFFSNSAGESGGAVYLHDDSHVSWSGDTITTVFDGNQAVQYRGGALSVTTGSHASCTADTTDCRIFRQFSCQWRSHLGRSSSPF